MVAKGRRRRRDTAGVIGGKEHTNISIVAVIKKAQDRVADVNIVAVIVIIAVVVVISAAVVVAATAAAATAATAAAAAAVFAVVYISIRGQSAFGVPL